MQRPRLRKLQGEKEAETGLRAWGPRGFIHAEVQSERTARDSSNQSGRHGIHPIRADGTGFIQSERTARDSSNQS